MKALNGLHMGTLQCQKGAERKRRRLTETETRKNIERAFHAYGKPMAAVLEFRYLGRMLTATDDDWPAVAGNIWKARMSWGRLARVLGREGADPKVSRSFYTAVTQQVLLFGVETWVLTKKMESALDTFQGRVASRLTGQQNRRGRDGKWFYPSLMGALKEAVVMRIRTSILRRHNTVAQFIATRPILGMCEVTERRQGTRLPRRWWEQTGIDWKAAMEAAAAKNGEDEAMTEAPELTGLDSEPETTAQGGTAGGTGEEESLGARGSSGAEWSGAED